MMTTTRSTSTPEMTTTTRVLYVDRRDAKAVKTALERRHHDGEGRCLLLDKRYRMTPAIATIAGGGGGSFRGSLLWRATGGEDEDEERRGPNEGRNGILTNSCDDGDIDQAIVRRCIAVPVTSECFEMVRRRFLLLDCDGDEGMEEEDEAKDDEEELEWLSRVVGVGRQHCPPSPAVTASQKKKGRSKIRGPAELSSISASGVRQDGGRRDVDDGWEGEEEKIRDAVDSMTLVQRAIYETLVRLVSTASPSASSSRMRMDLCRSILLLESKVCPAKLERLGDDTLVLPGKALLLDGDTEGSRALRSLLLNFMAFDDGKVVVVTSEASHHDDPVRNHDDRGDDSNDETGRSKTSPSSTSSSGGSCQHRSDHVENVGEVPPSCEESSTSKSSLPLRPLCHSIHREIVRLFNSRSGGGGAAGHSCRRLVRRGEIDPDSPTRRSGHVILYHADYDEYGDCGDDANDPRSLDDRLTTGPGSPGWITIKEYGIRQSFDLTRVMFSRGNVTEKRRFGSTLVRKGDIVLDMYAGIGYYTLPALILGGASHVIACEWNPDAAFALRHNLRDNGVEVTSAATASTSASRWGSSIAAGASGDGGREGRGRATVLEGDCRVKCREFGVDGVVDRVNLGLLPSSEGGWTTAVRSLRSDRGGWVHVHGNVPSDERETWAAWVCGELVDRADGIGRGGSSSGIDGGGDGGRRRSGWVAVCGHVERVKSYAPRVDHVVADVYVGPPDSCPKALGGGGGGSSGGAGGGMARAGFLRRTAEFVPSPGSSTVRPSCALGPGGVLHQKWMMEDTAGIDG